ncbi:MAG TPA: Rrf2 family transcriptional regulator [Chthoniobacteraceae bacterium]|nr:Rrf2 family transcriptional regulator [Chthoniobacteraceae bacterium]
MKLSKRGEYALRALIDIGIANDLGRPLVQIGELAEKERLPIKFLEQILMQLKEAGYIESKRGKCGGYYLLMPAEKIRFGQVIRLIDGPLAPVACVSQTAYERCTCPDEEHCGLRMLMHDVRNAIASILDRFTLADTVEMTLRKIRRNRPAIPFIDFLLSRPPVDDGPLTGKAARRKRAQGEDAGAILDAEAATPRGGVPVVEGVSLPETERVVRRTRRTRKKPISGIDSGPLV